MPEVKPFCLDSALTDYAPLPRAVWGMGLSASAMLLYALLLDRGTLSQKNGYANDLGQVYVIYTIEHLAEAMGRGTTAIKRSLKDLEEKGLIRRERCGMNSPSRIFLTIPTDAFPSVTLSQNRPSDSPKTAPVKGRKPSPNDLRKQPEKTNLYYQHSEEESL